LKAVTLNPELALPDTVLTFQVEQTPVEELQPEPVTVPVIVCCGLTATTWPWLLLPLMQQNQLAIVHCADPYPHARTGWAMYVVGPAFSIPGK